jgi:aldehyde:ferredoxin oxidoreductase
LRAVSHYGGGDYACVLGQEMAGYATGEVYFVSQALGFRHSHLDSGGYAYDQKQDDKNVEKAVDFLVKDERGRVFLTSMVSCLFARSVYREQLLAECLDVMGYAGLAQSMDTVAENIQRLRWKMRLASGYDPAQIHIPGRFFEVENWKGPIDQRYLEALKAEYAGRIVQLSH